VVVSGDRDDDLSDRLPKRVNLVSSTKPMMFLLIGSFFNVGLLVKALLIMIIE
jgi:hypothetical protein